MKKEKRNELEKVQSFGARYNPTKAVQSSVMGYFQEIVVLQLEHFPLKKIKLKIGNNSYHLI